jgi:O-antigen/teichoic acid export membrane protein
VPEFKRSLKERALSAGLWTAAIAVASTVMRFGSSLIMTRLLVPEIFGVVALAGVFYMIISLLSDIGLRQCVIYSERGEDQDFLDTIWSISALRGVFIAVLSALIALLLAVAAGQQWFAPESVYSHPQLPGALAGTALSSLWIGLKSPKLYLLERHLDFKTVGYIDVVAQLMGTVATVWMTYYWRSVWSIVIGSHVTALTMTVMSHFCIRGPIGHLRWDRSAALEIVRYGRWILLSSVAYVIAVNGDRMILGVWFTPALLGFYMLALNIATSFELIASRPFQAVGMPAFSEFARRGSRDLREIYFKFRLPFDLATVGAAGFIFATGQLMIDVLYDDRYATAGSYLQILSFTLLFPRFGVANAVHAALGEPQTGSWVSVMRLVSIVTMIPLGYLLGGLDGALWAIALHMAPGALLTFWQNRKYQLNDFAFELKTLLAWPAGYAIGMACVLTARPVMQAIGWH